MRLDIEEGTVSCFDRIAFHFGARVYPYGGGLSTLFCEIQHLDVEETVLPAFDGSAALDELTGSDGTTGHQWETGG